MSGDIVWDVNSVTALYHFGAKPHLAIDDITQTVSRLMKQMDYTETVNPAVKILVSQVFCHETREYLPLLFIHSLHAFRSAEQVHCSRHS